MNPVFSGNTDKVAAAQAGLPLIGGKQAVASAQKNGVTWCMLEDGTEDIRNKAGEFCEWPEA